MSLDIPLCKKFMNLIIENITYINNLSKILTICSIFQDLTLNMIEEIVQNIEFELFYKGKFLFKEGDLIINTYEVKVGAVQAEKSVYD